MPRKYTEAFCDSLSHCSVAGMLRGFDSWHASTMLNSSVDGVSALFCYLSQIYTL
jgi:hypothetical protein